MLDFLLDPIQTLSEKKDHIIKKLPNLSPEEKEEVIDFFNKNPSFENSIDWNNKDLSYPDFKTLFSQDTKRGKERKVKQSGIEGLTEGTDYIKLQVYSSTDAKAYIPLTYDASRYIASSAVGGCEGKWCTAYQRSSQHWFKYTVDEKCVLIYWILPNDKLASQISTIKSLDHFWTLLDSQIKIGQFLETVGVSEDEYKKVRQKAKEFWSLIDENNNKPQWINYPPDKSSGDLVLEKTHIENKIISNHKGPASMKKWADGTHEEIYKINGLEHRVDGPSYVWENKDRSEYSYKWKQNDKYLRKDGPALVQLNAGMYEEQWIIDGVLDRKKGPAVTRKMTEPDLETQIWYKKGKRHRDDGPALIKKENGKIKEEQFWLNGDQVESLDSGKEIDWFTDGDEPTMQQGGW